MTQYRVYAADILHERQTVLDIWRRNLANQERIEDRYDWNFLNNPAGPGRCWILEADGQPVGTTAMGMRPVQLGARQARAGLSCDMAVDSRHRMLQPALLLQKAVLHATDLPADYVYGVPNRRGGGVLHRAGYLEHCRIHRYARMVRLSSYLERHRHLRRAPGILGAACDAVWRSMSRIDFPRSSSYRTAIVTTFDQRFDRLWERLKTRHPLQTVRNSRFLRWRYEQCPATRYTTIGLFTPDGGDMLGYLVYFVNENHALCADLFTAGYGAPLSALISAWFEHAAARQLDSLSIACSGPPDLTAALEELRFTQRSDACGVSPAQKDCKEPCKTLFAFPCPSDAAGDRGATWFYTAGDSPYI